MLGSFKGAGLSLRGSIYIDMVALLPFALTIGANHVVLSQTDLVLVNTLRVSEGRPAVLYHRFYWSKYLSGKG